MAKIQVLSSEIANKIAAGEVVQRPLSVVKELVENSIDAGSDNIKIELKNSGLDSIVVTDNGVGMDYEDVKLSLTRHATSKVLNEEDIYKIMTLGFRGEALASISAVSKFSLTTSTDGVEGYKTTKDGDEDQKIEETSFNKGTKVVVKNLFFNTPARYKHLSSPFYELSLIIQYINKSALCNPNIKFELINNYNTIFFTLGDGSVINVMQKIYNSEIAKNILQFENENGHFAVEFYIVKPQHTRSKKNNMHIAVNNRIIKNFAIENMILKGYGQYLHTNQFPIVFLSIKTDYSLIDINIHPSKEQIKISLIEELEKLIVSSISDSLDEQQYISQPKTDTFKYDTFNDNGLNEQENKTIDNMFNDQKILSENKQNYNTNNDNVNTVNEENEKKEIPKAKEEGYKDFFIDLDTKENINNSNLKEQLNDDNINTDSNNDHQTSDKTTLFNNKNYNQNLIENGKFIGFFHKTYILYENEKGIYFVDQHAAQERIKYEQILETFKNKSFNMQRVLIPQIFDYTADEYLLVIDKLDDFKDLGLIFEKFGPNTLRLIEADSIFLKSKNLQKDIRNIINLIINQKNMTFEQLVDEIAIEMACKGSIKAHNFITQYEAENLLSQLSNCKKPYTCPHGRPIIVNIDEYQIKKMFKRVNN